MKEVEWSAKETMRLVSEYKLRPELWDPSDPRYRVQSIKYERWTELAALFGVQLADMRKKINSLLASHRREKGRVRNGGHSMWYLYKQLSFLPSHIDDAGYDIVRPPPLPRKKEHAATSLKREPTRAPIREVPPSSSSEQDEEAEAEYLELEQFEEPHMDQITIKTEPASGRERLKRAKLRNNGRYASTIRPPAQRLSRAVNLLRARDYKRKDECDTFGEYIAESLRKHDERTQSMIKQAINNILFEQEMKKYSGQVTLVVTGDDEDNPLEYDSAAGDEQ